MRLTCDPSSDYWSLERKVRKVVEMIHYAAEANRPKHAKLPGPVVKVTVGQNGIIILVRYAVDTYSTGESDEQVARGAGDRLRNPRRGGVRAGACKRSSHDEGERWNGA
jgi:hypothetical protein